MSRFLCHLRALTTVGLLTAGSSFANTPAATAPASADSFEREAVKLLNASHANRTGVVVHIDGQALAGVVKAIGADVVVLDSRELGVIVVRRERIAAVAGR